MPVYNEAESLRPLHDELTGVLAQLGRPYEVIVVDDGSTDETPRLLAELVRKDDHLVAVTLRRNFGQTAALAAGFEHASGAVVVTLDGDLQNDPADIPRLLQAIEEHDLVSGWRVEREDPFLTRRLPSAVANWLISRVTGVRLHDYGCTLKAYRREVVKALRLYGEMHRFLPAVASWWGVSIAELPVGHRPRTRGRSKYGVSRTLKVLLDLIAVKFLLAFSHRPIQVFGLAGLLAGGAGGAICTYLAALKLLAGEAIGGRPLLLLGVLLMVLGVQFVMMGLLGEMLVRVYHEATGRPTYAVKQVLGGEQPEGRRRGDERSPGEGRGAQGA
ncbi:MAG: glycosyltransferase family 2 protein [Deltaproteobacteria bacterium]|nr:glycosyltransferase family 2 protein [Deltaproteobacteria bacterium]